MQTELNLRRIGDVTIIHLEGDVDGATEATLTRTLKSLADKGVQKVLLNLAAVDHIHFQALQRLSETVTLFRNYHGDLIFSGLNPYIQKIFQAVAFELCTLSFGSVDEALITITDPSSGGQTLH